MTGIPTGPIHTEPLKAIPTVSNEANRAELLRALEGVELGDFDRRIVDWLAIYEGSTVATICSWLLRAREAGKVAAVAHLARALDGHARVKAEGLADECDGADRSRDGSATEDCVHDCDEVDCSNDECFSCPCCGVPEAMANDGTAGPGRDVESVVITPEIAAHTLFHFKAGGMEAGSFVKDLIMMIARADPGRRRLLARGFPAYVEAVDLAQNSADGVAVLAGIAGVLRGEVSDGE